MRRLWVLAATTTLACSAPGDPTYPDRTIIGPPPAVGDACELPFPVNFAQDWFVLADLDQGTSCEIFLEQDECAVGIYHDCTDGSANPREWQGVVDSDPEQPMAYVPVISLTAKYAEGASRVPRGPTCCDGGLFPRGTDVSPIWSYLTCHESQCSSQFDRFHTGMFLEQRRDVDPQLLYRGDVELNEGARAPDAVFANGAVWAIVGAELYTYTPSSGEATPVAIDVAGANHLAVSLDGTALYVAGTELVRVDVTSRMETGRVALSGAAYAIAVAIEGVIVSFDDGTASSLARYDAATLAPLGSPSAVAERIQGLVAVDQTGRPAVATAQGSSAIFAVSSTLTIEVLTDLEGAPGMELGPVEPTAPFFVDGATVGMIAPCYAAAPTRHCYFEVDTVTLEVRRVGIPDVDFLESVAYDVQANRVVFGTRAGRVAFVDRGLEFRPRVQELVDVGSPVTLGAIAVDAGQNVAYAIHSAEGRASIVNEPQ